MKAERGILYVEDGGTDGCRGLREEACKKVIFLHTQAHACTHDLHNPIATGDARLGAGVLVSMWIADKGQVKSRKEVWSRKLGIGNLVQSRLHLSERHIQ